MDLLDAAKRLKQLHAALCAETNKLDPEIPAVTRIVEIQDEMRDLIYTIVEDDVDPPPAAIGNLFAPTQEATSYKGTIHTEIQGSLSL